MCGACYCRHDVSCIMLYSFCIVCGAVDHTVDGSSACSIGLPSISHRAVRAQHDGCCMGGQLAYPAGVYGDNRWALHLAMSITHIECTLVLLYASCSCGSCIGFH